MNKYKTTQQYVKWWKLVQPWLATNLKCWNKQISVIFAQSEYYFQQCQQTRKNWQQMQETLSVNKKHHLNTEICSSPHKEIVWKAKIL